MKLKELLEKYEPYNEQEASDKKLMLEYINNFDDVLTRKNEMCHFTASSWIVNKQRTKVLMIYHNIYKSWAWTGGHCDGDDNALYVALKEAKEESGLEDIKVLSDRPVSIEIVSVDGHIKRGKYVSTHVHLNISYLFEADENDELKIKEDENSGVKWIDLDDINKMVSEPKMIPIYNKLKEKAERLK